MKKKLLLELARHLEEGKLGHEVFDFRLLNSVIAPKCGTAGCAIGELPILFPKRWTWNDWGDPVLSGGEGCDSLTDAEKFFGLDTNEVQHLFVPNQQDNEIYGGIYLDGDATRYQVACNIREFIAKKEQK